MTGPRSRRSLLRAGALGIVGLAGCVGEVVGAPGENGDAPTGTTRTASPDATGEPTGTASPTTETTASGDASPLAVADVRVQSSFVYLTTPDSMDVHAPDGTQFAFVDLRLRASSASESLPTTPEFALVADGRRFSPTTEPGPTYNPWAVAERGPPYDPDETLTGWVCFELPDPLDVASATLTYPAAGRTVSESLGAAARSARAAPPAEFELAAFATPASAGPDGAFDVSVTAENVGETNGVFRGSLNQVAPAYAPYPFALSIPAGERRTWTRTFGRHLSGVDRMDFRLRTPVGDREASVAVASDTDTTAADAPRARVSRAAGRR